MLEKASHDRAHADILRHAGNPRTQATDAAYDQIDLHAGATGLEQRPHELGLVQ